MVLTIEGKGDQSVLDHRQHQAGITQMKGCFGQNSFTREQRFGDTAGEAQSPLMMSIVAVRKGDEKPRIRNTPHVRENPLRLERFFGPLTVPAKRMNAWAPLPLRAFSN